MLAEGLKTVAAIEQCTKPVVAVVNGMALGGGCEICLACDLRIAADSAIFGQPEINLGIIPGWGGMHRLPKLIGNSRAADWLMTGRNVTADEALEAGTGVSSCPGGRSYGSCEGTSWRTCREACGGDGGDAEDIA